MLALDDGHLEDVAEVVEVSVVKVLGGGDLHGGGRVDGEGDRRRGETAIPGRGQGGQNGQYVKHEASESGGAWPGGRDSRRAGRKGDEKSEGRSAT